MSARLVISRDGQIFHEGNTNPNYTSPQLDYGVYRVEVYRDDLGPPFDKIPWIISNPIYVR
jgi:hypothetical protein